MESVDSITTHGCEAPTGAKWYRRTQVDDPGVVTDRGADAVGAGGVQALLKQAVRQQVRRDDYATVAGSAQVGDHVADLRFTRRDVADPYGRTGEFREHGRASAHVVAGARVGGPGRREDHRVDRAPAGLDESGVPDRRERRVGAERPGHRHRPVPARRDLPRDVGVHVIARREERRHHDRASPILAPEVGEHLAGRGAEHVDERHPDSCRPVASLALDTDPFAHPVRDRGDHVHAAGAAGAVRDQHERGCPADHRTPT